MSLGIMLDVVGSGGEMTATRVAVEYAKRTGRHGRMAVAAAAALGLIEGRKGNRGGYLTRKVGDMRPALVALTAVAEAGHVRLGDMLAYGIHAPVVYGMRDLGLIRNTGRGWWRVTVDGARLVNAALVGAP